MTFINGEQMLNTITVNCIDIYNTELRLYVFCYNENGSIAVYDITSRRALELSEEAADVDECWSAFLGPGGKIYDSLEYKKQQGLLQGDIDEAQLFCEQYFDKGEWVLVERGKHVLHF